MKLMLVVFSFLVAVLSADAYRDHPETQDELKKDFIRDAVLKALDDAFESDGEVARPYPHDNEITDVKENLDDSINPDCDTKVLGRRGRHPHRRRNPSRIGKKECLNN